ncbi:Bromodomain [Musa troglodytarum]|uniref:Bromodomain n=1 Tax=Musa troglodytarum TaxID=320322 RepID=A0A9E7JGZ7_9LILI|nr:Bromodomain [Musa troglodytarum]
MHALASSYDLESDLGPFCPSFWNLSCSLGFSGSTGGTFASLWRGNRRMQHKGSPSLIPSTALVVGGSRKGFLEERIPKERVLEKVNPVNQKNASTFPVEADVDIDIREVYFLIMHFLSSGPCKRTYGQLWNELLEHQLLPRRYHAWYSRCGARSGDEDDDGMSLPLCYIKLAERYPHVEKDHLIKLLKQLILNSTHLPGMIGGVSNAADVPTLLGSGSFSLLESDKDREDKGANKLPVRQLRSGGRICECLGHFEALAPSAFKSTVTEFCALQGDITDLAVSSNNAVVASSANDFIIRVWRLPDGHPISVLKGHAGAVTAIAFSPRPSAVYQLLSD